MTVRIGTSGWSYDHWAGVLYPPKLAPARRLRHYIEEFDTVELNASFYRWPKDSTFSAWQQQLPDGFAMSVKAHRGLTHYRRLNAPGAVDRAVANAAGNCWMAGAVPCWYSCIPRRPATTAALTTS